MLKIGNIKLKRPFVQAPLAGYSDRAMRVLARQFGCELTFSGVILDTSALYKPLFRKKNYIIQDDEHPIGGQLLGAEPETMAEAAVNLRNAGYDMIDLNFACPARKVVKKARGGSLMAEPKKILEILNRVRNRVQDCPITMKLRIGIDHSQEAKDKFWQICDGATTIGIDALIVHGRAVNQAFRNRADWEIIKKLKQTYPDTTIIGSGDLFEPADIVDKLRTSGADGILIARGTIGKPWLFQQIADVLDSKEEIYQPDIKTQGKIILNHFTMLRQLYDEKKCIGYFRKFTAQYSRSYPKSKKLKAELVAIQTEKDLISSINKWYGLE